jgi:hypothetical protein
MEVLSHMDSQYATSPSLPFPQNPASIFFDSNQISDLLETFDSSGMPFGRNEDVAMRSSSTDSAYDGMYNYAVVSEPSRPFPFLKLRVRLTGQLAVLLDPAWTLPRRGQLAPHMAAQAVAMDASNENLSIPSDHNDLHPSSTSAHSSPPSHPRTPNMQAVNPPNSAPDGPLGHLPQLEGLSQSPLSAPAMTFEFTNFDGVESMAGPARNRFISRSYPYSPPQHHQQDFHRRPNISDDHLAPADPQMYGRRRSVSMSYIPPPTLGFEGRPSQATRQSSHPPPLMPSFQPNGPGFPGFAASREVSVKDRKAMAQKRRATMQHVIADARLPSSITARRSASTSTPTISLQQALDSLNAVESYLQHLIMSKGGEPDLTFVTTAHCHLIKDLQCRLKSRAREQGLA